jgi:pentatricopeptide repeat protein
MDATISHTIIEQEDGHLKPDHGENFVPGAEAAPDNQAPQPLDHFKRGYKERADLREREANPLSTDHEITTLARAAPPITNGYSNATEGYNRNDHRTFHFGVGVGVGFDVMRLVDELCKPGCVLPQVLERARAENVASFTCGKALTAILSNLARRRKIGIALSVWQWMDTADIRKNVFHYNSLISVCEKMKDNKRALRLMDEMREKGIPKNEVT